MDILFYTILFIIGLVIGNFLSIKANKIPKSLDMRKTYYSKYKNNELISKMTYIFIGGVTSVILANILDIHIEDIDLFNIIIYIFAMIFVSILVLIAGIDRVYTKIEKRTLGFGIISSIIYMIYLCAIDLTSIYLSLIYLAIYMVLLIIDTFLLRRYAKDSYIVNIFMLFTIILAFTDLRTLIYTVTMAFIAIIIYILMQKSQKKISRNKELKLNQIPVGYFVAVSNIIVLFMIRVFESYII